MLRLREKQTRQVGSEKCQPRDRDKKTWAVKRQNVGFCLPPVDTALFFTTRPEPGGHDIANFQAWPRTSPIAASLSGNRPTTSSCTETAPSSVLPYEHT